MKLKHYIDRSIFEFPTLYRSWDYKKSRLHVLNQIFLVNGNGLEWHPKGFLANYQGNGKYSLVKPFKLPIDFFTMNLWHIDMLTKDLKDVKKILKGHFYYILPKCLYGDLYFVFEAPYEIAKEITKKFDVKPYREELKKIGIETPDKPSECCCTERNEDYKKLLMDRAKITKRVHLGYTEGCDPYPICSYSALAEMIKGKTNSPHIENFELNHIQPDWVEGALEIAEYTLSFYNDPEKYKRCYSHPSNSLYEFKKLYDLDPSKFREERKNEGMLPEHTIEQWCEICWQKRLAEQIGYCKNFIEIYGE